MTIKAFNIIKSKYSCLFVSKKVYLKGEMDLSIIIPTLNEEDNIGFLINYLQDNAGAGIKPQIIVADAGSQDQTKDIATKSGAMVIDVAQKSRAVQMNYATSQSTADVLYFVHADTRPPINYGEDIIKSINEDHQAGCFTSIFDWNHPFLRFCNAFSRLPFWFCRGGGQTLFVTSELFNQLEGFDEKMLLMEEYDFITRARQKTAFKIIRKNAITSARDYRINGAFRLQLIYSYIFFLYATGASQDKILQVVKRFVKKA